MTAAADIDDASPKPATRTRNGLAGLVARRTTDLMCIAILGGALVSTALALRPFEEASNRASLATPRTDAATVDNDVLFGRDAPLRQRQFAGMESDAWEQLVADCRVVLIQEVRGASSSTRIDGSPPNESMDRPTWIRVDASPTGDWELLRPADVGRLVIGVPGGASAEEAVCWGMMSPGPGDVWNLAVLRLSPARPAGE
ncbi:MAG: hypothetical protein KF774_02835 [Planctomyces sp.]|nr:hypothetical protein [Planctomyces sp.]